MGRRRRQALSAKDISDLQLRSRHPGARLLQTWFDGLILQIHLHLVRAHPDNSPSTRYSLLVAISGLTSVGQRMQKLLTTNDLAGILRLKPIQE